MAPSATRSVSTSLKIVIFVVDAVWYLSWAAAAFAILAALVVSAFPQVRERFVNRGVIREPTTFSLPLEIEYPVTTAASGDANSLRLLGHDDVVFAKPFERADLASYLPYRLAIAAVFLWTFFQLRALLRAVRDGRPFDPRNPARIRRIGYVLIAAAVLGDVATFLLVGVLLPKVVPVVKQALPNASVAYQVGCNWQMVVVGLVILAIAHAFDAGVRLQDDQDLTV